MHRRYSLQWCWLLLALVGCGSYTDQGAGDNAPAVKRNLTQQVEKLREFTDHMTKVLAYADMGGVRDESKTFFPEFTRLVYAGRRLGAFTPDNEITKLQTDRLQLSTELQAEVVRVGKLQPALPELMTALNDGMKEVKKAFDPNSPIPVIAADDCPWWASLVFVLLMLAIFGSCVAFLLEEGIWGNAIRLVTVVFAGLMAMNFYEPLAAWLTGMFPAYSPVFDMLSMWAIFVLCTLVSRELTDRISRIKVRFLGVADRAGGIALACWIGWLMVCFTLTSLHTAPLAKNFFFGAFDADRSMFCGLLSPDREWLAFTKRMSEGALSTSDGGPTFDPRCDFGATHTERRLNMQEWISEKGTPCLDTGS